MWQREGSAPAYIFTTSEHPEDDANKDGIRAWPEYKAYREKFDPVPVKAAGK